MRGSCTDPSFSSEACPNFCLHKGAGLRHSVGLNMTLCETDPQSTLYCCNEGDREACDCSAKTSHKVRLNLFDPVTTIGAADAGVPSASTIRIKISSGAATTPTSSRFLQRPVHQAERWFLPWKTLGPILLAVFLVLFAVFVVYFIRHACHAKRRQEPRRASIAVETGPGRRYSDWAAFWDENRVKSNSKFSIGSLDSEVSPSDNGRVLWGSRDRRKASQVSTHLSPEDGGLRRRKSDEHEKSSLEADVQGSLREPYLGRQRCESMISEPVRKMSVYEEQRKPSKVGEEQTETTQITADRTLQEMLNSPFLGRQNSVF